MGAAGYNRQVGHEERVGMLEQFGTEPGASLIIGIEEIGGW